MPNLSISDGLYLLHRQVAKVSVEGVKTEISTDHILVCDCSGSMTHELPKIRQQLKNKTATMLKEGDTLSIVWFSGRNQFGVVIEGVELRNALDLPGVHRAIDTYLKPLYLTGFVEPLAEVERMIGRIQKPGRAVNLFFMSDGYDNQWPASQILEGTRKLAPLVSSAAVVEYGWYCNRPLMIQMAEQLGATEVLAKDFDAYEPVFETAITKRLTGIKKIDVTIDTAALHGFAFSIGEAEVIAYAVEGRTVSVPEGTTDLYWFAEAPPSSNFHMPSEVMERKTPESDAFLKALYAGLVPLTQRMLSTDIFRVLKLLGDVRLIQEFTNCFGKQAYLGFQDAALAASLDPSERHAQGYDPKAVPAEDAYTVLDLLYELQGDDGNKFYPNHSSFNYQRIGRKAIAAEAGLTEAQEARVGEIAAELTKTRDPAKIKALQAELTEFTEGKTGLKFVPENEDAGYAISNLVTNEDRPNISAMVKIPGTIDLSEVLDESLFKKTGDTYIAESGMGGAGMAFPVDFPTGIYRNFTVIRDGIRNIDTLPVTLTENTQKSLADRGVIHQTTGVVDAVDGSKIFLLDLTRLPLINRKMVKAVSARNLFEMAHELFMTKAAQKVFNYYADEYFPPASSAGFSDLYGADVGAWLGENGIKDYGYSPLVKQAEATDFYMGRELKVAMAGLSSLPSVADVLKKMGTAGPLPGTKKALTAREAALEVAIKEVQAFLDSPGYKGITEASRNNLLHVWLTDRKRNTTMTARRLMRSIAEIKFSIIVGQVWFTEFSSLDENSLTMKFGDQEVVCTANLKEIEVKV